MAATLTVVPGTANPDLGAAIAAALGIRPGVCTVQRFPDGELQVDVQQGVRGHDVYLVQSTSPPVDSHLVELAFLADACRRAGAARVTAITPYFGYARQDRRVNPRQALGGRVVADMLEAAPIDRFVVVDLHTPALEGFFSVPLEHLSAVPLLAAAVTPAIHERSIVIAPDLGAVKLAEQYARRLDLPMAIVHKARVSGHEVDVRQIVGDVRDRSPVIVDDMLSTGATIRAAMAALVAAGCRGDGTVVVSHGLFVGMAEQGLPPAVGAIFTTDSVRQRPGRLLVTVCTLAPLLADAIRRLHTGDA